METMNKLGANMQCITGAEKIYSAMQSRSGGSTANRTPGEEPLPDRPGEKVHIDFAA